MKSGMKDSLENLILTSNKSKDREKALEILTSIEDYNNRFNYNNSLIKEYKLKAALKRPKTACSRIKGELFSKFVSLSILHEVKSSSIKI